jgi:hypothetical protein
MEQAIREQSSTQLRSANAQTNAAERREPRAKWIQALAVIAIAYATDWIVWRWTSTINAEPRAIVPSLPLLVAETWAYVNMCFFVFVTWRPTDRDPGPAIAGSGGNAVYLRIETSLPLAR